MRKNTRQTQSEGNSTKSLTSTPQEVPETKMRHFESRGCWGKALKCHVVPGMAPDTEKGTPGVWGGKQVNSKTEVGVLLRVRLDRQLLGLMVLWG